MLFEEAFYCDVAEDDLAIYGLLDGFVGVVLCGFVLLEFLFVGFEVVAVYFAEGFYGEFEAAAFVCAWFSDDGYVEYGFFCPSFFDFDGEGVAEGEKVLSVCVAEHNEEEITDKPEEADADAGEVGAEENSEE